MHEFVPVCINNIIECEMIIDILVFGLARNDLFYSDTMLPSSFSTTKIRLNLTYVHIHVSSVNSYLNLGITSLFYYYWYRN